VTDRTRGALETLATRGERRGAESVHSLALRQAARRRRRSRAALGVTAAVVVMAAIGLWWRHTDTRPAKVSTAASGDTSRSDTVTVAVPPSNAQGWRSIATLSYGDAGDQIDPRAQSAALSGDRILVLDNARARVTEFQDDASLVSQSPPLPDGDWRFVAEIDGGVVVGGPQAGLVLPNGSSQWLRTPVVGSYGDGVHQYDDTGTRALSLRQGRPDSEPVDAFRTTTGQRFRLRRDRASIEIEFLDPSPHTTRINLAIDGSPASDLAVEFASDAGGNLQLLVYGPDDKGVARSALVAVTPAGVVTSTVATPSPAMSPGIALTPTLTTGSGVPRIILGGPSGVQVWAQSPDTEVSAVPRALDVASRIGCEFPHEKPLPDASSPGQPLALIACRLSERQLAVAVYANHDVVTMAARSESQQCGTRVIGDDWIVLTDTPETSALVAGRIGGDVPPATNC